MVKKKNYQKKNNKKEKKKLKKTTFVEALFPALALIILSVLQTRYWKIVPFLNEDYLKVLQLHNICLLTAAGLNASRIVFRHPKYRLLTEIISSIVFLYFASQVWIVYPFDTSVIGNPETWDKLFRGFIIFVSVITVSGSLINFVKLISPDICLMPNICSNKDSKFKDN